MTIDEALRMYYDGIGYPMSISPTQKKRAAITKMLTAYTEDEMKGVRSRTQKEIHEWATVLCLTMHTSIWQTAQPAPPCENCKKSIQRSMDVIFGKEKKPKKKKAISAYCTLCHKWTDHLAENCKKP